MFNCIDTSIFSLLITAHTLTVHIVEQVISVIVNITVRQQHSEAIENVYIVIIFERQRSKIMILKTAGKVM